MDASDMDDEDVTIGALRDELLALRREAAARDARTAAKIDKLTETLARPKGKAKDERGRAELVPRGLGTT